nr:unnamed protein product [Haemonchus contortus]
MAESEVNTDKKDVPVFYIYHSLEEAHENKEQLAKTGMQYLRFEASPILFDVAVSILTESEVLVRMHAHSNLLSMEGFPTKDLAPIRVPFDADEFENFLFGLSMLKKRKDLQTLSPSSLCSLLRVADYFECPNLMRLVFSHFNKLLSEKSPTDICEAFDILNDFSQTQKQQMEREGLWCSNNS